MIKKIKNYILRRYYKKIGLYHSSLLESYSQIDKLISSDELNKIKLLKRYQQSSTNFLGQRIEFSDNEALIGMINEIFLKKNYMFHTNNESPLIIDCGANIGLSVIFFKQIYPNSKIICFEPDPEIYKILEYNLKQFNFTGIEIYNSAVWTKDEKLTFQTDKSWGGKIVNNNSINAITIDAIDLNQYLAEKVDFLKIDIEGAEVNVIKHCAQKIIENVEHLFFEWHSFSNSQQKLGEILNIFEKNNFRYHLKEASPKGAPFFEKRLEQIMDTQIDCFIYKR
jgi:FkbM family methyltransferase